MQNTLQRNGGLADYYKILALLYLLIAVFNTINHIIGGHSLTHRVLYSVPFLLASIFMLSKYKRNADLGIDIMIASVLVIISRMGDLSAAAFIMLVVFRLNKRFDYAAVSAAKVTLEASSTIKTSNSPAILLALISGC